MSIFKAFEVENIATIINCRDFCSSLKGDFGKSGGSKFEVHLKYSHLANLLNSTRLENSIRTDKFLSVFQCL